jgi:hypothetical protein
VKKLYVCGSFRFVREMKKTERKLKEGGICVQMSKMVEGEGILGCLRRIDEADVVYVINPGGYVGKSVSVDIGYAYAKGKEVYAMFPVDDPPVMGLMNDVLSPEALAKFLKEGSAVKT